MIYIINIAENPYTKRGRRHVKLFNMALEQNAHKAFYISSNFDHSEKRQINCENKSTELYFKILPYKSNLSLVRQLSHMIFAIKTLCYLAVKCSKNDIVILSSIPAELPFVVALIRKVYNIRLIIDVRDVWPNAYPHPGVKNKLFSAYVNLLNRLSFSQADEIIIANPDFESFVKNYGCTSKYVPLGYDSQRFNKSVTKQHQRSGCVYLGNLNASFDITTLAEFCQNREVSIYGEGDLKEKYTIAFGNSSLKGFLEYDLVPEKLKQFEYGLLPISGAATLPNKLYDYIASGLSIVTNDLSFAEKLATDPKQVKKVGRCYLLCPSNCRTDFMADYDQVSQKILGIAKSG